MLKTQLVEKKLFILFILISEVCFTQTEEEKEQIRRSKIELILKMQDMRTVHDGKLVSFLSDSDDVVREKATFAFGSIQDTAVLHLLIRNLTDKSEAVQSAAGFAIGQTGMMLSPKGKKDLETQLIWKHLGNTSVDERLIEELGKFGTEEALNQLMIRYGTLYPRVYVNGVTMSIARFAIRNIYNSDAIKYLTSFIKPETPVNWRAMYALMRISSMPESHKEILNEIHNIAPMYKSGDPFVRMNLATLLGRLKDEKYCIDPLQRMADYDRDWRVRVNAIRALANFDLKNNEPAIETFKRAFYDENMHIALTALSAFANTKLSEENGNKTVKETFEWLGRIVVNPDNAYRWQYQGQASITYAKLVKGNAVDVFRRNLNAPRQLLPKIVEALAQTGSVAIADDLLKLSGHKDPLTASAALEGLQHLCKRQKNKKELINNSYDKLITALESREIGVLSTAATILRDSIFLRKESVDPLVNVLNRLRIPQDTDAIQEIVTTLGLLKDEKALKSLRRLLQVPERAIAIEAASALQSITGKDYSKEVQLHMQPIYVDYDYKYLDSIRKYPIVKIETIRGDIQIELNVDAAPFTVLSFVRLVEKGFYRGTIFHRIVPNFVIQGGDPEGTGWGGPGYSIRSEFSPITYDAGSVGMASSGKDTEGSQYFITQSPQPHLDGRYTVFGKVISGIEIVNTLQSDDRVMDVKKIW